MPDIAFHISSQTAHANGFCPSGDRTRVTLPIDPAIQVPNDAQPTVYLHNIAFSNTIANVSASDESNLMVLRTGSTALKFQSGGTKKPWLGIKYKASVNGTMEDFALAVPLTAINDNGFLGPTYDNIGNFYWSGQPETLDGMTVAQVYTVINNAFKKALGGANSTFITDSMQNRVVTDDSGNRIPTAAFTVNGNPKVFDVGIAGSSANGLVKYNSTTTDTGGQVTIDAELVNPAVLEGTLRLNWH
eukprot:COSAG06_NODE_9253_length_1946_cov_1.890954_3_plen_245_part_00